MGDPGDGGRDRRELALQDEIVRLKKMTTALMDRAEREMDCETSHFGLFQTALMLEGQVRNRTRELESALRDNERINRDLQHSNEALQREQEEQKRLIGELEDAHGQLLRAEKLASIGQLAAGVAHEINNPIGFVHSNLGTLKDYAATLMAVIDADAVLLAGGALDPARRAELLRVRSEAELDFLRQDIGQLIDESLAGSARIRHIVRTLLDFAHADEARWQLADLRGIVDASLHSLRGRIGDKAQQLCIDCGELPEVECVPAQLDQALTNLLVNAAQAIDQTGTVTVRGGQAGDEAWISVADTGCGIADDDLRRIFDPFFTTKPVGSGTGLGLTVAYGVMEKHRGRIEVSSTPGQGSTFTLRLPLRQPSRAGQP